MEDLVVPYSAEAGLPARSVLVFAPHPDDEIFGCGGALALHVRAQVPVRVVVLTDGAAGGSGEAADRPRLRMEESRAAARVIGFPAPDFWQLPDRGLAYGEGLVERIAAAIRNAGADLVYAPSVREMHPDHLVTALACLEAVRRTGGELRLAMYEVGVPLPPTTLVDITAVRDLKAAAGKAFVSQLTSQDYDRQIDALNRFRTFTLSRAVVAAEAYWIVTAAELRQGAGIAGLLEPEAARRRKRGLAHPDADDLPLVSILVRSMDRPTLAAALDAVAAQTYSNLEVVVVAAAGAHRPLPERWGGAALRLVSGGGPLARSAAANLALDSARGDYVMFLDDDDLFDPGHIAGLLAHLRAHPGCRAAYSAVRTIDGAGNPLEGMFDLPYDGMRLLLNNYIPIHAVLFERSLVAADGCRFDPAFSVYEDWDFWLQVSRRTAFAYLDTCTAAYRIGSGNGFGVNPEEAAKAAGLRRVYEKWLPVFAADGDMPIPRLLGEALRMKDERRHLGAVIAERDALIHSLQQGMAMAVQTLAQRDAVIGDQQAALRSQETAIRNHEAAIRDRETALQAARRDHEAAVAAITRSTSWRLTAPLRAAARLLRRLAGRSA